MDGKRFHDRMLSVAVVLSLLLLGFGVVLYQLQIVNGDYYRSASAVKISNQETVDAARGEILDRYGRELVTNRATYQITLNTSLMGAEAKRNANLLELIQVCRTNGLTWTDRLPISVDAPFTYTSQSPFAAESDSGVRLTTFGKLLQALPFAKKDEKAAMGLPTADDAARAQTLDDLPQAPTAEKLMEELRDYFVIDPSWSDADARAVIGVLYEVNLRRYEVDQSEYIFARDVGIDVISGVKERGLVGVTVEATTVRQYETTSAAHLLGRVGPITAETREHYQELGYRMDEKVGVDGLENAFESYLRGKSGLLDQELSTSGKVVSENWHVDPLTGEVYEPQPGYNVMTTLDLRLQEKVEQVLASTIENLESEDKEGGAVVVQSVKDGGILAMASYPTYDLSTIYTDNALYQQAANDPLRPFNNRATMGVYPPGSTFKPLVAIAALEEGVTTPSEKIQDTGALQLPEEEHYPYGDWHPQCWIYRQFRGNHGWEDLSDALRDSCNIYFYTMGHRLGIDRIVEYADLFGLGKTTGLELPEAKGRVASPETSEALGMTWYGGNLLNAAIGQDNNQVTMVQLSNYIATLVNGGNHYSTHLLKSVKSSDYSETIEEYEPELLDTLDLDPANVEAVKKGMWEVANDPKSTVYKYLSDLPVEVGAKTGSAQVASAVEANAVFVCFAPYDDPEIAISMVVEGGASGSNLAQAVGEIVSYYFSAEEGLGAPETENALLP